VTAIALPALHHVPD
jgi:hypothetical protein